jgi:hypothetical protein
VLKLLRMFTDAVRVKGDCRGRDRMIVGFTTTYAIDITTDVVSSNRCKTLCDQV